MRQHPKPTAAGRVHGLAGAAPAGTSPITASRLPLRHRQQEPLFIDYYRRLRRLPSRVRRALERRWRLPLATIALLLALGQAPALAATIQVDGVNCALADAIRSANADAVVGGCVSGSGADTLVLAAGSTHTLTTVEDTTYGATGLPLITSTITIDGHGSTVERAAGAPLFRLLAVGPSGDLLLLALTLSGGVADSGFPVGYSGGGLLNQGTLTLRDSTVRGNFGMNFGGGLFNHGSLVVQNSTVSDNRTTGFGGGIYNDGTLTLVETTVSGNWLSEDGGGVYNRGTLSVTNGTISSNTAGMDGGGLQNSGTLSLLNTTVSGNSANELGGGVHNRGTLTVTQCTITANSARFGAGGLSNASAANLILSDSIVSGNSARDAGGGLSNSGTLSVTDTTISANSAEIGAGLNNGGTATITNSTLSGNGIRGISIGFGGGLHNSGTLTLAHSTVSGNTTGEGGGLTNIGTLTLVSSTVSGNAARTPELGLGGGGMVNGGTVTLVNTTVSGNWAFSHAGGVHNRGTLTLAHSLIAGNTASYESKEILNLATVQADNFNLFGTNGSAGVVGFTLGATDIVPPAGVTLDQILAPLANNGGATDTHALVPGSPALDASPGDADCPATDQRGVLRPQGLACDIGAFEAGIEPPLRALVTGKAGPTKARRWSVTLSNPASSTADNARIDRLTFRQSFGAACTPLVTTNFPLGLGTIAAGGSAAGEVLIDFSGCAKNARFSATIAFSADQNAGSKTLKNQFR